MLPKTLLTWPGGLKTQRNGKGHSFAQGTNWDLRKAANRDKNLLVSNYHSVYRGIKANSVMVDLGFGSKQVAAISICLSESHTRSKPVGASRQPVTPGQN